jgi:hypothetical protein
VDAILRVHHDPGAPLEKLDEYFKMKEGYIQVPTFYLGAKLKKTTPPMMLLHGALAPASMFSLLSRMSKNIWRHSLVTRS